MKEERIKVSGVEEKKKQNKKGVGIKEARKAKQGGQKTKKKGGKNPNGREGRKKQKKDFHQMQLNSLALVTFPCPYSQSGNHP